MKFTEPHAAFESAIQLGLLSRNKDAPNFAWHFMYVYTDPKRGHAFKHRDTRKYIYTGD